MRYDVEAQEIAGFRKHQCSPAHLTDVALYAQTQGALPSNKHSAAHLPSGGAEACPSALSCARGPVILPEGRSKRSLMCRATGAAFNMTIKCEPSADVPQRTPGHRECERRATQNTKTESRGRGCGRRGRSTMQSQRDQRSSPTRPTALCLPHLFFFLTLVQTRASQRSLLTRWYSG